MTALAARLRPRWDAALGRAATAAGWVVGRIGRSLPGVVGPLLVCYGIHEIYEPAAYIAAGAFLLVIDGSVPKRAGRRAP